MSVRAACNRDGRPGVLGTVVRAETGAPGATSDDGPATVALRAALRDDLDAGFVELVRSYETTVYSIAASLCSRSADAEELAAEAFLRAYRALGGYDHSRLATLRPRPWLATIVLNTWRNTVRAARRRPQEVTLASAAEAPLTGPAVDELAEVGERRRALVGMLAVLPPNQRVSVVLRHVAGFSIAEVAGVLGCPEGTAKSHVSRGLRHLRDLAANGSGRP